MDLVIIIICMITEFRITARDYAKIPVMLSLIRNYLLNLLAIFLPQKSAVKQNITYKSQFASEKEVKAFVTGKKLARLDVKWKSFGALSPLDYEFWVFHICGTACLQMILATHGIEKKIFELARDLKKAGAYVPQKIQLNDQYQTHPEHVAGLFYRQFCDYINRNYPFTANIAQPLTLDRIRWELSNNNYVIASVHKDIREFQTAEKNQGGGHLVVVTGYNKITGTVTIHNPSGFHQHSQQNHQIPVPAFVNFFAGRGVVIRKKQI